MSEVTKVHVQLKFVRNIGNFESVHVELGVDDYTRSGETVDQAMNRVYAYVENKLQDKVNEIENDLK